MRAASVQRVPRHKPLVIRGGLARTFGSLASFIAILFLLSGLYLLRDALENPLDAQAPALLAAAFSITLAAILLYYLLKPRRRKQPRVTGFRGAA
jgi:uncharacterized BrkB/YihY/UPF0761 family membrane protein